MTVRCAAHDLGAVGNATVPTLRGADVLVVMHGGDMANGIRLLPGRTAVELVNCGFQHAGWEWLDAYKRMLTPIVRHVRLVMPPGGGNASSCPDAAGRARVSQKVGAAWNADSALPWALLEPTLRDIVEATR